MLKLATRKRACGPYETACIIHSGRQHAIVVQLFPKVIELRLKGQRVGPRQITYEKLFWIIARMEDEARRATQPRKRLGT
jgi:hypothetical protein